ncbi:4284_t:CDS:1, partial [Scutellospora calospora]
MNQQPISQAIRHQLLRPQNLPQNAINTSFDDLNSDQKHKILTKGMEDPFVRGSRT